MGPGRERTSRQISRAGLPPRRSGGRRICSGPLVQEESVLELGRDERWRTRPLGHDARLIAPSSEQALLTASLQLLARAGPETPISSHTPSATHSRVRVRVRRRGLRVQAGYAPRGGRRCVRMRGTSSVGCLYRAKHRLRWAPSEG